MNREELKRKLNSVGRAAFIKHYSVFKIHGQGQMSREDCIEHLVADRASNDNGAAIRCSNAKLIFQANKQCDALKIICGSTRLSLDIINMAERLLATECG